MRSKTKALVSSHLRQRKLAALSLLTVGIVALTGLMASFAQAQQVYRIIGPDGKVTFSDTPPPAAAAGRVSTPATGGNAGAAGTALPFELRQIASRFPVTLYTGANCEPCGAARNLLTGRGIPFTEKTVNSNDDAEALKRLSGETSLPFATIGSQQLKGFSDAEWSQFLTAAGYPAASVLPASYRAPAVTPLVAVAPPASAASAPAANSAGAAANTATRRQLVPNPADANPAGIKF